MAHFTNEEDLQCDPLAKQEKTWIKRLEKVLLECPSKRLSALTIGDPSLQIYDYSKVNLCYNSDACDGGAYKAGIVLANISSSIVIEGISG